MMINDRAIGDLVLLANSNYQTRPIRALVARVFGERQAFVHLGRAFTIAWLGRRPYLIRAREIRK